MKHRFRRGLAAVAVLASGLVAGGSTPASAWEYFILGPYVNSAAMVTPFDTDANTASISVLGSFDSTIPYYNWSNRSSGSVQTTGGSATLYVKTYINSFGSGDCTPADTDPDRLRLEIRNQASTAQQGSFDRTWSWSTVKAAACDNNSPGFSQSVTVNFDQDPLDGDSAEADLAPGTYSIFLQIEDDDQSSTLGNMSTKGDHAYGDVEQYTSVGTFTVTPAYQYLNGTNGSPGTNDVAANESAQGPGDTNKDFSLIREFEQTWGTVNTSKLNTWVRDEGKVVVWSTKPKNWTTAWTCNQTGDQVPLEPCTGTSPWAQSAADETTLDSIASTLNNAVALANDGTGTDWNVPFIGWAITHEPHDDAILDYTKGWRSGKCGTSSNAGADPAGSNRPCSGTAADYLNLYAEMREAQQTACGGPCANVKIMYIAVGSNMYYEGPGSKATSDVGEGDQLRPAAANYDILGADTYNYSCFANSLQPSNFDDGVGNGTTTFTSATANFVSGDVGLKLEVRDVGVFTIVSRTNSTTVVLSGTVPSGTNKKFGIFRGTVCSQSKWESFEEIVDHPDPAGDNDEDGERYTVLGLARKLNKKVILAEYASHPGCNGVTYGLNEGCYGSATDDINGADGQKDFDRAAWFQQMYTWLTTDADPINYLLGFAYFHSAGTDLSTGDHDWRFLPAVDDTTDHAYVTHGETGRETWQNTIGSDANFVPDTRTFTRPLS